MSNVMINLNIKFKSSLHNIMVLISILDFNKQNNIVT